MVDDRRRSLRWRGILSCRFIFGEESSTAQIADLSFEGACVTKPTKMPPRGSEIILALRPEQENITLKAKVVYVEKDLFGVEFLGSRTENLKVLKPFFFM